MLLNIYVWTIYSRILTLLMLIKSCQANTRETYADKETYYEEYGLDITGISEIDDAFIYLTECSGVYFDFDSCIAQTSFQLLSEGDILGDLIMGCANGTLPCMSPSNFTEDVLFTALEEVVTECYNETDGNIIDHFFDNITSLLDAETCWENLAENSKAFETVSGSIRGDLALDYVGNCVGVEMNLESCVLQSTLDIIFSLPEPHKQEPNQYKRQLMNIVDNGGMDHKEDDIDCLAPKFSEDELKFLTKQGDLECELHGENTTFIEVAETINILEKLFGQEAEKCWFDICTGEAQFSMISTWLEMCANVQLPLPPPMEAMEDPKLLESQSTLACMVEFALTDGREVLDEEDLFPGSIDICMPPLYHEFDLFCPSHLGLIAFEKCAMDPTTNDSSNSSQISYSRTSQSQTSQSRTIQSQTSQSQTSPSQTSHRHTSPSRTSKSQTSHSRTSKSQTSHSRTSKSQTSHSRTSLSRTLHSQPIYSNSYDGNETMVANETIMDEFCGIMKVLSSEEVRACLLPVCFLTKGDSTTLNPSLSPNSPSPSAPPVFLPSSTPSTVANKAPPTSPPVAPSKTPTTPPSIAPSSSSTYTDCKTGIFACFMIMTIFSIEMY